MIVLGIGTVAGLTDAEQAALNKLQETFNEHGAKNDEKDRYYEGKISLSEVNLGIALPDGMRRLEIGCSWGAKTVDVLAARSMFDGFVGSNGEDIEELHKICVDNRLIAEYAKACRDELEFGCTFVTVSPDEEIGCKIRFHSPRSAAALWDGEKGRIGCGLAVINTALDNDDINYIPTLVNMYTDDYTLVFSLGESGWNLTRYPNKMGRPLMEALIWNATSSKPFGRSRIKEPIRRLIQGYVRTVANATIGLEFATSPQKYLLGVTDEQYDALINNKFKQYVGSILASTTNPETGEKPSFGQLTQGNIQPHVEMLRALATQFSAATGLSSTDTGVISVANPTSADALIAQTQTLIGMAEDLNVSNGDSLRVVAMMALAIIQDKSLNELSEDQKDIVAHFKNPSMPSVASTADAALKIASVRGEFSQTDTFLEMIGFSQADIRRIKGEEAKIRGSQVIGEIEA